jgi:hypothetical protein
LFNDLGSRLKHLLKPETKSVLASVGPGGGHGGWLEYMRQLLNQPGERTTKQETTNRLRS